MGSLLCTIKGHQWANGVCHRCGEKCKHENIEAYDSCTDYCTTCKMGYPHHDWQDTDIPWKKVCSVCGKEDVDGNELILWERAEKKRKEEEEAQRKKDAFNRLLEPYKVDDDNFRCMGCREILPMSKKSATYDRPICMECSKELKSYYGHTVLDKIDCYDRTVTCILCLKNEYWHDAEHQGALLQDCECTHP